MELPLVSQRRKWPIHRLPEGVGETWRYADVQQIARGGHVTPLGLPGACIPIEDLLP
jgi:hypothetical protein